MNSTTSPLPSIAEQFRPRFEGIPNGLDLPALNVFFRTGFFLGTSTAFREVTAQSFELPSVRETSLGRDQVIDAYIDLFRASITRCIGEARGRVCMGVSGGRDSRHILLELCRQGAAPDFAWTADSPSASDASVGRELCTSLGVRHRIIAPMLSICGERCKNVLLQYSSIQHGWAMGVPDATIGYDAIYDGIGGDVLSAGLFLTPEAVAIVERGRLDEYAESITPHYPCLDEKMFPRDEAVQAVYRELSRYVHYPSPLSAFWFANRTRRDIAPCPYLLIGHRKQVMTPYLQDDLVRFLLSVPARMTVDHKLHTDTIARDYPSCTVPYAAKSRRPGKVKRRIALDAILYAITCRTRTVSRWPVIFRLIATLALPHRDDEMLAHILAMCEGLEYATQQPVSHSDQLS